jgi:hypothetical protein
MQFAANRSSRGCLAVLIATITAMTVLSSEPARAMPTIKMPDLGMSSVDWGPFMRGFDIGFDVVVLRPLGFTQFIVASVLFVPTVVMGGMQGREGFDEAREVYIDQTFEQVFRRPIGEF